jgi:hypothetical protein
VLETCAVSDQKAPKFFVKLPTWKLQAGHMGVVREIMEFYYRKAGRRLQVGSLLGGVEVLCAVKIRGEFLYDWWWWSASLLIANGLWAWRGSGPSYAHVYANSQVP